MNLLKKFWRWHDECAFFVAPVAGALSVGEIMTVSPRMLAMRVATWLTLSTDDETDEDGWSEADLKKIYEAFAEEGLEVCEIDEHGCDEHKHLTVPEFIMLVNETGRTRGFNVRSVEEVMAELKVMGYTHD